MLGKDMTWEQIFEQTDRDINLQRVMNIMKYGKETGRHDWIPERAMGPTDERLYEAELAYNDQVLVTVLGKTLADIQAMPTCEKLEILMAHRKQQLRKLIQVYYMERGWNTCGIPTVATLQQLGLWGFLTDEAKTLISGVVC